MNPHVRLERKQAKKSFRHGHFQDANVTRAKVACFHCKINDLVANRRCYLAGNEVVGMECARQIKK
jgi:hypothetical protein